MCDDMNFPLDVILSIYFLYKILTLVEKYVQYSIANIGNHGLFNSNDINSIHLVYHIDFK